MRRIIVSISIALALCCLQAVELPAKPVTVFPRPERLTIGYIPTIYITQFAAGQERGWFEELGVTHLEFLRFTSGSPMLQAIAAGQIDGAVYGEPQITRIQRADPKFKVLLYSKDFVPGLPGGVVMVQQRLIDQHPVLVENLVELHLRANKLFNADEDFFARTVTKLFEEQFLPIDVAQAAVRSPSMNLVTNHRRLADRLALYDAFEVKQGIWPKPLKVEDVFEYRF